MQLLHLYHNYQQRKRESERAGKETVIESARYMIEQRISVTSRIMELVILTLIFCDGLHEYLLYLSDIFWLGEQSEFAITLLFICRFSMYSCRPTV